MDGASPYRAFKENSNLRKSIPTASRSSATRVEVSNESFANLLHANRLGSRLSQAPGRMTQPLQLEQRSLRAARSCLPQRARPPRYCASPFLAQRIVGTVRRISNDSFSSHLARSPDTTSNGRRAARIAWNDHCDSHLRASQQGVSSEEWKHGQDQQQAHRFRAEVH